MMGTAEICGAFSGCKFHVGLVMSRGNENACELGMCVHFVFDQF